MLFMFFTETFNVRYILKLSFFVLLIKMCYYFVNSMSESMLILDTMKNDLVNIGEWYVCVGSLLLLPTAE